MNTRELFRAIGDVDGGLIEQAHSSRRQTSRPAWMRWGAAACLILAVGIGVRLVTTETVPLIRQIPDASTLITPFAEPVANESRKNMAMDGHCYAFAGNGARYDFSAFDITMSLGTLDHELSEDMASPDNNQSAAGDFATTWAPGGTVYEIPGYDPAFRVAVEQNGAWYMAELVANLDGTPLDAGYYFDVSAMRSRVRGADVIPGWGVEALHRFGRKDARTIVDILATASPAALSDGEREAAAQARSEGRSWQLCLRLADDTTVTLDIIPNLALFAIGDDDFYLPAAFMEQYGERFTDQP